MKRNWREIAGRIAAEFAIVVMGVTIALWADDWASDRSDRRKEISRLNALRDNVDDTLVDISEHLEGAKEAADNMRAIVQHLPATSVEQRERIGWALFYGPVFSPELNVYDDLKSSGELSLLTNPALRGALATMDASMGRIDLAQLDLTNVQQLHIDSFAVDNVPVRLFYGDEVGLPAIDVPGDEEFTFLVDPRFRSRLVLKLDLVTQVETRFRDAEAALNRVRELIDEQLGTY